LSISEERFIANSHISAAHSEEDRQRQQWQKCIEQLTSWKHDPGQLDEEGTVTPSQATIRLALDLADSMCKRGLIPPTRIVPDADGGIVFERQKKDAFEQSESRQVVLNNGSLKVVIWSLPRALDHLYSSTRQGLCGQSVANNLETAGKFTRG